MLFENCIFILVKIKFISFILQIYKSPRLPRSASRKVAAPVSSTPISTRIVATDCPPPLPPPPPLHNNAPDVPLCVG